MLYIYGMKCPDCGQDLGEVAVTGFDKSFRCKGCGGTWMEGWVPNSLAEGKELKITNWQPVVAKAETKTGGVNCPADSQPLFGYAGEEMPAEVTAFKCSHCGWWWFPADNLLKFKKAYEAKVNYLKFWKRKSEAALMVLHILMVLVLMVGLGVSVVNVSKNQATKVRAGSSVEFRAEYKGNGEAQLRFRLNKPVEFILLRQLGQEVWGPVPVRPEGDGGFLVTLTGLPKAEVYQVQIEGKRYYFQTK